MEKQSAPAETITVVSTDQSSPCPAGVRNDVSVTLVVPTLNESRNLQHVLPYVPAIVDEIIIVDGGSCDDTVAVARALRPDVNIVYDRRPGKGYALRTGFEAATGDVIVMMDADGSMNPLEIDLFVSALLAGADVVKGSRYLQGGGSSDLSPLRNVGNTALTWLVRMTFGGRYSDLCYGYIAFWRHVLPTFIGGVSGFEVETFLNVRALAAGLRIVEVASFEDERIHGESNLRTFRDGFRVLRTIADERRKLRISRAGIGVPRPHSMAADLRPALTELADDRLPEVTVSGVGG